MPKDTKFRTPVQLYAHYIETGSDKTLTKDDCPAVVVGTGAIDVTLPAASDAAGMMVTFVVGDGGSDMNLKPASGDGIKGVINDGSDASALITYDGTDNDYLASASGSNNVGDRVTVVSDGSADWYIVEGAGAFSQTSP